MKTPLRRVRRQRGAALLEAAILIPLLLILVFGIVDVGRLVFTQMTLHDASQEGSIYGAYNPGNVSSQEPLRPLTSSWSAYTSFMDGMESSSPTASRASSSSTISRRAPQ